MRELSVDDIVARVEVGVFGDDPQGDQRVDRRDLRALIADWRKLRETADERSLVQSIRLKGLVETSVERGYLPKQEKK